MCGAVLPSTAHPAAVFWAAGHTGQCVQMGQPRFAPTQPTAGAPGSPFEHYHRKCAIINNKYLWRSDSILPSEQPVTLAVYYSFQEK